MRLGIMQPYFFPYIGYFQLVNAVDTFVFYDDVFYTRGWFNRNCILNNDRKHLITVKLQKASNSKRLNTIPVFETQEKILKTISMFYRKAPFFRDGFPLVENVIKKAVEPVPISEIAADSVMQTCAYLDVNVKFKFSSRGFRDSQNLGRAERLIDICHKNEARYYINAIGGKALYEKEYFLKKGIELSFLRSRIQPYKQFKNEFVPDLSMASGIRSAD